ncbi:hypothetical protein KKH18_05020 [bacterium]|nr:hypothetical protein [bacterium]
MASSPDGKARSRMNALKHGLRATDELFLKSLNPKERSLFRQISKSLHQDYKPQTTHEKLLVDRIAIQHFRSFRLYKVEVQTTNNPSRPFDIRTLAGLDLLSRYDSRIQKDIKSLHNRLHSLYIQRGSFSLIPYR